MRVAASTIRLVGLRGPWFTSRVLSGPGGPRSGKSMSSLGVRGEFSDALCQCLGARATLIPDRNSANAATRCPVLAHQAPVELAVISGSPAVLCVTHGMARYNGRFES